MLITYDTEFLEDGVTIELISIGLVAEDGREYYAVNAEMPMSRIREHKWLMDHVVPHLPSEERQYPEGVIVEHRVWRLDGYHHEVKIKEQIAREVLQFIRGGEAGRPELWAYYPAYDHVALCQLWGPMAELPKGVPKRTSCLKQHQETLKASISRGSSVAQFPEMPVQPKDEEHHALFDARHDMAMARALGLVPGGRDKLGALG